MADELTGVPTLKINSDYVVQWKFIGDEGDEITAYAQTTWVDSFQLGDETILVFERTDKTREDGSTIYYYFDNQDIKDQVMVPSDIKTYQVV